VTTTDDGRTERVRGEGMMVLPNLVVRQWRHRGRNGGDEGEDHDVVDKSYLSSEADLGL